MIRHIPYIRYRKPTRRQAESQHGRRLALRRRVLEWLCQLPDMPTGIGCDVAVNGTRNIADVAAFWSRRGKGGAITPCKTIAVVCALDRGECWAAGINPDSLMLELRGLREQIARLQETIRKEEPGLKDTGALFEEFAEWNYDQSSNAEYHRAVRHCHTLEGRLYNGTRSERLKAAQCVDEIYVAIPEGTLLADEVTDGCGLLEVPADESEPVRLIHAPRQQEATPARRLQLVQTLAAAAMPYVGICMGLKPGRRTPKAIKKGRTKR